MGTNTSEINNLEGLKGLRGLKGLSNEERDSVKAGILKRIPAIDKLPYSYRETVYDRIYRDDLFVSKFGKDTYNKLPDIERDNLYESTVVDEALQKYQNDKWFPQISNMTTEGKISLLESGFQTDSEFKESISKTAYDGDTNKKGNSFWSNFALAGSKAPGMIAQSSEYIDKEMSSNIEKGMTESRNSKFLSIIAEDNTKKIEQSSDVANQYLHNLQQGVDEGKITYANIEEDFDKFIGETSNHYKAFKDSDIFENFTVSDKMKYLSEFMGVANKFGVESAVSALNTKMQNYVSDNQDAGDWAVNTGKALFTKFVAEFMNTVTGVVAGYKAVEDAVNGGNSLGNYLQGKDENGNDLPSWYNPLYYQGMDQYNLWTVDAINEARQNGGISDAQNITRAGEEMDFFSWKTINDAIGQIGYMGSIMAKNAIIGGAGKLINTATPALRLSRLAQTAGTTLELGASVAGMSEMEGLSSFQETLQQANEIIDSQINEDTKAYVEQQMNTDEVKLKVQNEIMRLKNLYSNKELYGNKIVTTDTIVKEAISNISSELYNSYKIKNSHLYDSDREKALDAATQAYMTTATLFAAKEATTNGLFQKFLFSKGTRRALRDNGPKAVYTNNPDGTISATISKWQTYGKPIVQQPLVEALEEASDSYVNNLGQGLGLNEYNSYHQKKYNPEAYVAITDGLVGNVLSGITKANESMLNIDPWYEGFVAAISGVGGAAIDTYYNKKGNKYIQEDIARINKILKEKGNLLEDATAAISIINEANEAVQSGDLLRSVDLKQAKAFEIIKTLSDLSRSEAGKQSGIYSNTIDILTSLVEGTISDEKLNTLVGQFLGQGNNKSIAEKSNSREEAIELLKDNASYLLNTQKSLDDLNYILDTYHDRDLITEDVRTELGYMKVMREGWKKRLEEIENNLGVRPTTVKREGAEYGSKEAYIRKKQASLDYIKGLEKELKSLSEYKYDTSEEKKALKLRKNTLKDILKKAREEHKAIERHSSLFDSSDYSPTLSKEEILALPAEQRAWMLNEGNLNNYSQEQQLIIKELRNDLVNKDPSLLQQIQDASSLKNRISDVNSTFSRIINNPIEAAQYLGELRKLRNSSVVGVFKKRDSEKVEKLFKDVSDEEAISIAKNLSYSRLEDYLNKHPEKKDLLKDVSEVSRLRQNALIISGTVLGDSDNNIRQSIRQSILNITSDSNNKAEAIDAIKEAIDSNTVDEQTKSILDTVLGELQELDYQRNATKVSDRKSKKKRHDAKEKAEKEANRKREEAEIIAREEAKSKEKEVPKDGSGLLAETTEDPGVLPDGSNTQETIEVDERKTGSIEELTNIEGDVKLSEEETDTDNSGVEIYATDGDPVANTDPTVLVGNYFYRYKGNSLKEDKYQEKREGSEENDQLNRFFSWVENAGIKLQEIIDNELASIMKIGAKVQFMMVIPNDNATHDDHMKDHIFEVVEYTDKVAKIHKEDRGGVISANNKRWLIVGVAGPKTSNKEQGTYLRNLKEQVFKRRRYKYSKANPNERFYVDPEYYSQIESIGAGWLVRKLDSDTEVKIRSITELIKDSNRNPKNIPSLEDVKWLIQTDKGPKTVNVSSRNKIRIPKDGLGNSGNTFILIESANGEYIPAALKPVMYSEIKEGQLKNKIEELLIQLTSNDRVEREDAINKLIPILHLKEKNILLSKDARNNISIVNGNVTLKTFNLDDPLFNRMEFLESVGALNPRINITTTALSSPTTLRMLDEAGALTTDIALLGTTNADFNIYNVNAEGKPIINEPVNNEYTSSSDLKKTESSVLILGQVYRKRKDGWVDTVDRVITDPRILEQIRYNNIIQSSNLAPVATKDNQEYFIISQDMSNPVSVKRTIGTNTITVASKEQAVALIEQMVKKAAEKKAAEALSKATFDESSLEDVSLEEEVMTQEDIYSQMFGEFVVEGDVTLDENISEDTPVIAEDINTTGTKSLAELQTGRGLSTLSDILGNSEYGNRLDEILDRKAMSEEWGDIPDDISLLGSYLRRKGIATSGITDVNSWLNMIDECK